MRVERQETFLGIENEWDEKDRDRILALTRRMEGEFDNILTNMQDSWAVTNDTERIVFGVDGSRLWVKHPDGSFDEITVDFKQDTRHVTGGDTS